MYVCICMYINQPTQGLHTQIIPDHQPLHLEVFREGVKEAMTSLVPAMQEMPGPLQRGDGARLPGREATRDQRKSMLLHQ